MSTVEKMGQIWSARSLHESARRRKPGGAPRPNNAHVSQGTQAPVI